MSGDLRLFALGSAGGQGTRVAGALGVALAGHEEREFEDGEHKARPLESVRGDDVYVLAGLYGGPGPRDSVNDRLVRLLFFVGALKDAGAARVTVVVPYLCYARKDRKTKPRDPITTRYLACLLEAAGTDVVVTLDVHNLAAYQNAFRIRTEHLEARPLFVDHFSGLLDPARPPVVVSPDVGGVKRAEQVRETLERRLGQPVPGAFMEKKRSAGVVSGEAVVGEVEGRAAIIVDDMIAGGTTLARTAAACAARGAGPIYAAASHGLFVAGAEEKLSAAPLEAIAVTDSVEPFRLGQAFAARRLRVLDSAALLGQAIERLHGGGSIVDLLEV